jgi:mRNA-decapping enzyme subunit 2
MTYASVAATAPLVAADSLAASSGPNIDWKTNIELEQTLEDVHTRFLLNLPPSELATADRIFFQLEQAWWFYEDMICDAQAQAESGLSPSMPRFSTLKPFAKLLFEYSPLFNNSSFNKMWAKFSEYKRKISTFGTLLVNSEGTHIVLCQIWNGDTWTLPAGKINQGESGIQAAARETFEETGFDPHCEFGQTKEWLETSPELITWKNPLPEGKSALTYQEPSTGKQRTSYVCHGVPFDFPFAPVARKEVSNIKWFPIDESLPKKTFAVLPFVGRLKAWIRRNVHNNKKSSRPKSRPKGSGRDKSRNKSRDKRYNSNGRQIHKDDDPLIDSGLATVGDKTRWTEKEMFLANEKIIGKEVDYDGNPHLFSEMGFNGNDPHAFRVVGGSFMNTTEGLSEKLVEKRKQDYQPLLHGDDKLGLPLTPFFTPDGATPWGDVIKEAKESQAPQNKKKNKQQSIKSKVPSPSDNDLGSRLLARLQAPKKQQERGELGVSIDAQITSKSQRKKIQKQKYFDDSKFINNWVKNLPRSRHFSINVDHILPS